MIAHFPTQKQVDAMIITRYIRSCQTLDQLQVCDNMMFNFAKKYGRVSFFETCFGIIEKPSWFSGLCEEYEIKEQELSR